MYPTVERVGELDAARTVQSPTFLCLQYTENTSMNKRFWACSIAFEAPKNHGNAYIYLRVRPLTKQRYHNLHVLTIHFETDILTRIYLRLYDIFS